MRGSTATPASPPRRTTTGFCSAPPGGRRARPRGTRYCTLGDYKAFLAMCSSFGCASNLPVILRRRYLLIPSMHDWVNIYLIQPDGQCRMSALLRSQILNLEHKPSVKHRDANDHVHDAMSPVSVLIPWFDCALILLNVAKT